MKLILSLNVLSLAMAALGSATAAPPPIGPFSNCATGLTDLNVTSIVIEPKEPCSNGGEVCFVMNGTLSYPIVSGGKFSIIGRSLNKIVYVYQGDLMDGLVAQGYPNPVPVTTTSLKYCYTMKTVTSGVSDNSCSVGWTSYQLSAK